MALAIGAKYPTVHRRPASAGVQPKLAPFGNILGMLRQANAGDVERIRAWLQQPHERLDGIAPLAAMLRPVQVEAVEQWLTRVAGHTRMTDRVTGFAPQRPSIRAETLPDPWPCC